MKNTFEHFPPDSKCPICKQNIDSECWLMPIDGTEDEDITQAAPTHVKCTGSEMVGRMRYNESMGVAYITTRGKP